MNPPDVTSRSDLGYSNPKCVKQGVPTLAPARRPLTAPGRLTGESKRRCISKGGRQTAQRPLLRTPTLRPPTLRPFDPPADAQPSAGHCPRGFTLAKFFILSFGVHMRSAALEVQDRCLQVKQRMLTLQDNLQYSRRKFVSLLAFFQRYFFMGWKVNGCSAFNRYFMPKVHPTDYAVTFVWIFLIYTAHLKSAIFILLDLTLSIQTVLWHWTWGPQYSTSLS